MPTDIVGMSTSLNRSSLNDFLYLNPMNFDDVSMKDETDPFVCPCAPVQSGKDSQNSVMSQKWNLLHLFLCICYVKYSPMRAIELRTVTMFPK